MNKRSLLLGLLCLPFAAKAELFNVAYTEPARELFKAGDIREGIRAFSSMLLDLNTKYEFNDAYVEHFDWAHKDFMQNMQKAGYVRDFSLYTRRMKSSLIIEIGFSRSAFDNWNLCRSTFISRDGKRIDDVFTI